MATPAGVTNPAGYHIRQQPSPGPPDYASVASNRDGQWHFPVSQVAGPNHPLKVPGGMFTEPMGVLATPAGTSNFRRILLAFLLIWPFTDEPNDSRPRSTCGDRGEPSGKIGQRYSPRMSTAVNSPFLGQAIRLAFTARYVVTARGTSIPRAILLIGMAATAA